uniref:Uncharacterized protein n=1 Tax=Arundo donax TaxID=35708 RepID=A0A0A9FWH3_ARUDO
MSKQCFVGMYMESPCTWTSNNSLGGTANRHIDRFKKTKVSSIKFEHSITLVDILEEIINDRSISLGLKQFVAYQNITVHLTCMDLQKGN